MPRGHLPHIAEIAAVVLIAEAVRCRLHDILAYRHPDAPNMIRAAHSPQGALLAHAPAAITAVRSVFPA